jgi:tRNA pseudouridine38/39 synthase
MRQAAKKLEGHHDFRNLCKIDASKQMPSCERRITFADVVEFEVVGGTFDEDALSQHGSMSKSLADSLLGNGSKTVANGGPGPQVYTFCVHGTAFLWHQVRCMVAMLFLVGQGLEEPSLIDELLDVEKNPGRPMYEMADDAPLVLWDCVFPDDDKDMVDSLNWLYAGDEATLTALSTKNDGKFGVGGVVDELWRLWREAKMKEILAGSLLDLAIGQGDGSALQRGSQRNSNRPPSRSQKVFQGADNARLGGRYIPVMQKPKMDPLHRLNAKWANGRQARRDPAASKGLDDGGGD